MPRLSIGAFRRRLRGSRRSGLKHVTRSRSKRRFRKKGFRAFRRGFDRTSGVFQFTGNSTELKLKDRDWTDAFVAAAGYIDANACAVAQGTGYNERIGHKITIKSLNVKWSIKLSAATSVTDTTDTVRMMILLDKQANGAAPIVTDILISADLLAFNNPNNKNRFKTLMNRVYTLKSSGLGNDTAIATTEDQLYDEVFLKMNIPIEYSSTTGAITEIRSNNIVLLLISTDGLASFDAKVRIRYSDK